MSGMIGGLKSFQEMLYLLPFDRLTLLPLPSGVL